MAIKPLRDNVLIKELAGEEKTKGGIVLPDTAKEKPQEGEVVAAGKGKIMDDGSVKALEVKQGDKVLFAKYSGIKVKHDDTEYLILNYFLKLTFESFC